MINLVPPTTLRVVKNRYRERVVIVVLVLVAVWLAASIVVLATLWGVLYFNTQSLQSRTGGLVGATSSELAAVTARTEEVLKEAALVAEFGESVPVHQALSRVLATPHPGVKIEHIAIQTAGVEPGLVVTLKGVFLSRQNLVTFVDRLRQNPFTARVEAPVENLVNETNGPFTITIMIAEIK